jgi:hypothetical protein
LEKIISNPINPSYTLTKKEFDEIINKRGGIVEDFPDDEVEMINEGALYYNLNEGDISLGDGNGVKFAFNIMEASLFDKDFDGSNVIWDSWDDFNCVKLPLGNWFEASGRVKSMRECQHETFYTMLAMTRALKGDDEFAKRYFSESDYNEVKESSKDNTTTMTSHTGYGIDNENFKYLDPSTGEMGFIEEGREGLWLGEE